MDGFASGRTCRSPGQGAYFYTTRQQVSIVYLKHCFEVPAGMFGLGTLAFGWVAPGTLGMRALLASLLPGCSGSPHQSMFLTLW